MDSEKPTWKRVTELREKMETLDREIEAGLLDDQIPVSQIREKLERRAIIFNQVDHLLAK